jgi:DNA topoisomerase-3
VKAKGKAPTGARKTRQPANVGGKCPDCKKGTIQLKVIKTGKNAGKSFKGCSGFPACRYFAWPEAMEDEGSAR